MVASPSKPAPTFAPAAGAALQLPAEWPLTNACLLELAALNESLCFERSAEGALVITGPPGNLSGVRAGIIFAQLANWSLAAGGGICGPADVGYERPDSSVAIPDASWLSDQRLAAIDSSDEGLWRVCPDFVLEVRSRSQSTASQQEKMERWMANGVRLGWLLDPFSETVWIYRAGQGGPERLTRPNTLSGESVLEGLSVDLARVWPRAAGG